MLILCPSPTSTSVTPAGDQVTSNSTFMASPLTTSNILGAVLGDGPLTAHELIRHHMGK